MDIDALLVALETSRLATGIRDSQYWFPLIESVHVIGLTLVFGTILIIDLRLLGFASIRRPFSAVAADVLTWTWLAFAVTVISGALMFSTGAGAYYRNEYFRAKMVLLIIAGVNMAAFELTARRTVHRWDRDAAPATGKAVAALSLVVWLGVIFMGRWVGFAPASAPAPAADEINLEDLENLIPK